MSGELRQRIASRVLIDPETGCWNWQGRNNGDGYGYLAYQGRSRGVHRWAYEAFVGPIPEGLQIDHLCRNRGCCNPEHLEPVTNRENTLRGLSNVYATGFCSKGHDITENGLGLAPASGGRWRCRQCKRENKRLYRSRRRAERGALSA